MTVSVLVAATCCAAADLRRYCDRTFKCASGCLSIEDDRRVVVQNSSYGFNGIWRVQETEQGWLIPREMRETEKKRDPPPKPAYLSYVEKSGNKDDADAKSKDLVFLSETPLPNSYWKLDIPKTELSNFDCQMRPLRGEFDGWYLTLGEEISGKKTPTWNKKFAVNLVRDKPEKPIRCVVDSP